MQKHLRKVDNATEVRHEETFGVQIDLRKAGIVDKFDQAAVAVSVGAVNASRNKTSLVGDMLIIVFSPHGLSGKKIFAEAQSTFSSIRNIVVHKAHAIEVAAQKAAEEQSKVSAGA